MRPQSFFLRIVVPAMAGAATLSVPTVAVASTLAQRGAARRRRAGP